MEGLSEVGEVGGPVFGESRGFRFCGHGGGFVLVSELSFD